MDETALVSDSTQGLTPDVLNKLDSYEDYLSFYIQLEEASTAFSWLKADTLYQMAQKLGDQSITELSRAIKQPKSTVISYIRVAKAFPTDKREPALSFSAHYQASYADSFNDQTQEFEGENRFNWVQKAAEEELSTREISQKIKEERAQSLRDTGGEEAVELQDGSDKVTQIKTLLHDLLQALKRGDRDAYNKIKTIHEKIYG